MRLVECDKEVLNRAYRKTKLLRFLEEFVDSDMDCAKIEGWNYASPAVCYNTIKRAIERFRLNGIAVRTIGGEVYLYKKIGMDD